MNTKNRVMSILLAFVMMLAYMPAMAFAEGESGSSDDTIASVTYHQTRPIEANKEYFDSVGEYSLDSTESGKVQYGDYLEVEYTDGSSKRYSAVMYHSVGVGHVYILRDEEDPGQAAYFTVNEDIEAEKTWTPGNLYQCTAEYEGHQFTLDVKVVERPSYNDVVSVDFTPNGKTVLYEAELPVTYEDEDGISTHYDLEARGNGIHREESLSVGGRFFADGDELTLHYQDGSSTTYTYDDTVFTFLDGDGNPPESDWLINWGEAGASDPDFEWPELVGEHSLVVNYGNKVSEPFTVTVLGGSGETTSGTFDNGITWDFSDGMLTIEGTGEIPNCYDLPSEQMPWHQLSGAINKVVIGEGITSVGHESFRDLANLSKVDLPNTLNQIGVEAFSGCAIEDLVIPEGVTFIDERAFADNKCRTARVTIPASLATANMNDEATLGSIFLGGFAEAIVAEDNPDFRSVDGVVYSKDMTSLWFYPMYRNAAEYSIPETVNKIKASAIFFGSQATDTYLKTLTIPGQVGAIGTLSLYTLENVYINRCKAPSGYVTFGTGALPSQLVHVPEGAVGYNTVRWRRANVVYDGSDGHEWSEDYNIDIPPTHLREGTESQHCTICGASKKGTERPVAVLGPDEGTIAGEGSCGSGVTWKVYEDGSLIISGTGDMENYNGASAQPWNGYYINDLRIEDGVTSIGNYAFSDYYLAVADIADSVTKIGESSFQNATINSIKWPDTLRTIGINAFNSARFIESNENGEIYTDVNLPESLLLIGNGAFNNCSMKSITIPKNVRLIYGVDATSDLFSGCSSLERIDVDPDNQYYASADGVLIDKSKRKIIKCPYGHQSTAFTIPDDIEAIGSYAFNGNNTIVSIQGGASLKTLEPYAFNSMSCLENADLPDGLVTIGYAAFANCSSLESVSIPDSVSVLDYDAFQSCISLSSITIPETISTIKSGLFYGCTNLREVTVKGRISCIESGAFCNCSNLRSFTIPSSVNYIGSNAFEGCSSLERILILSKNCTLDGSNVIYPLTTIYGIAGSTAQTYAEENRMDFVVYTCDEHEWNTFYSVDKAPTVTEEGIESIHCAVCDVKQEGTERSIPMLGEDEGFSYGYIGDFSWKTKGPAYSQTLTISGNGAIDSSCFNGAVTWDSSAVSKIVFEDGVTGISGSGFQHHYALQQAILPESLSSVDVCAFSDSGGKIVVTGDNTEIKKSFSTESIPVLVVQRDSKAHEDAQALEIPYDFPEGHTISNVEYTQEATCNSEGWIEGYCDTCGQHVTETIPITEHTWNDFYTTDTEPTRYEEGTESIHCSYCGAVREGSERTIPATGYDYVMGSGQCGENITWKAVSVDSVAELIISGSGSTYDLDNYGNTYLENFGEAGIPNWSYSSIRIEEGVSGIGDYMLGGFGYVDTISIPASMTEISPTAFANTTITNVNISGDNQAFEKIDGVLFTKDHKQLVLYPASKEDSIYVVPDGVEQINRLSAPNVSDLTIPASVTSISDYGVQVSSWATIHMAPISAPSISDNGITTLGGSNWEFYLYVPKKATGYDVLPWSGMAVIYGIPVSDAQLNETYHLFENSDPYQLTCTILPEEAAEEATVQWRSDDESIATVDSNGYVTPVGVGSTNIQCSVNDNITLSCQVEVPADVMTTYELSVQDGWGGGRFCPGQRVAIGADYGDAYRQFSTWEAVEGSVSIEDAYNNETYLIMPESDVTVKPTYGPTELGQAIIDRDALFEQLSAAEQSINDLNADLAAANDLNQQLQETINNKDLTIAEKEEALQNAEAALAEVQAQLDNVPEDLQDAAQKLAEANAQITSLQGEINDKDGELASVQRDLADALSELDTLRTSLTEAQANCDQLQADLDTANAQITELQAALDEKQTELDNKQSELDAANQALNTALAEKDAAIEEAASAKRAADDAQTKLNAAQATIETLNGTIENMETEAAEKQAALEQAAAELETAQTALITAQNDLAAAEKKVDEATATIAQLQGTIEDKDGELVKAQQDLADAKTEIGSLNTALTEAEEKYNTAKSDLAAANASITELQTELDEKQAELDNKQTELAAANQALSTALAEKDAAIKAEDKARKAAADAQTKLETAQATIDELNATIDSTEAEAAEKQAALEKATADLEAAKTSLDNAQKELATAEKKVEDASATISQLQTTVADKDGDLSKAQNELSDVKTELTSTKAALASVETEQAKTRQALEEASGKVENLQQQLDQANADKEAAEKAKADAQKSLEQAKAEADAANKKIDELNGAAEAKDKELADKDSELAQAKKDLETANAAIDKASADKDTAGKDLADANARIAELEKAIADKDKALAEEQEKTKRAEEEAKKAQEELEAAKAQQTSGEPSADQQGTKPEGQDTPSSGTEVKPENTGAPVIKLSATEFTYKYKVKAVKVGKKKKKQAVATVQKPSVESVTLNGKAISADNYNVVWSDEESSAIGEYTVTVTLKGSYSGKATASYTINPKAVNLKKAAKGKKKFTASWKKLSKNDIKYKVITGYELRYATDPEFTTDLKTIGAGSYKGSKKAVSKLQPKTTYYVQLRTYKTVGGKKYYSGWSSTKKVVTK